MKHDNIDERDFRPQQRVRSRRNLYEMIVKRLKAQQISESKFLFNKPDQYSRNEDDWYWATSCVWFFNNKHEVVQCWACFILSAALCWGVSRRQTLLTLSFTSRLPRSSSLALLPENMLRNDPKNSQWSRYALSNILIKQYNTQKYQEVSQKGKDIKTMTTSVMIRVATPPFFIPHMNSRKHQFTKTKWMSPIPQFRLFFVVVVEFEEESYAN